MSIINLQEFIYTLTEIHKKYNDRKFCFILGAGASVEAGINTGQELSAIANGHPNPDKLKEFANRITTLKQN